MPNRHPVPLQAAWDGGLEASAHTGWARVQIPRATTHGSTAQRTPNRGRAYQLTQEGDRLAHSERYVAAQDKFYSTIRKESHYRHNFRRQNYISNKYLRTTTIDILADADDTDIQYASTWDRERKMAAHEMARPDNNTQQYRAEASYTQRHLSWRAPSHAVKISRCWSCGFRPLRLGNPRGPASMRGLAKCFNANQIKPNGQVFFPGVCFISIFDCEKLHFHILDD